jgi:hypothetical protein
MRETLQPLIAYRSQAMGREARVFTVFPGETKNEFLARNGVPTGPPEFERVPYYLLIAASPCDVPFEFQTSLHGEFATGRLHFDTPAEYAAYVQSLFDYESREPLTSRELLIWAPQATFDRETSISASFLVPSVAEQFKAPGFRHRVLRGPDASKERLWRALTAPMPPAILFTTGHSLVYPAPHADLVKHQGALVGQEWELDHPITPAMVLSADDFGPQTALKGLVQFAFSSYSAGTSLGWPGEAREPYSRPRAGDQAFVAALPRRLLTSGALAFIGHLGRTWSYPYSQTSQNSIHTMLIEPYGSVLRQLARGTPVGHALRQLHEHTILLGSSLAQDSRHMNSGRTPQLENLLQRWTAWRNGSSAILIGDPAVRIQTGQLR